MLWGNEPPCFHESQVPKEAGVTDTAGEVLQPHDDAWSETISQQAANIGLAFDVKCSNPFA